MVKEFFQSILSNPILLTKTIVIFALFVGCIVIISVIMSTFKKQKFDFETLNLNNEQEKQRIADGTVRMFPWEKLFFRSIGLKNPARALVWGIRIFLLILLIAAAFIFNWLTVYAAFEVGVIFWSRIKTKEVEDLCGLSFIPKTNNFLDMYIPAINNGQSVNQIMDRFVAMEKDPELTLWWNSENRDVLDPPLAWLDVVKIYRNGYYSEQNGNVDSAEIYQKDIMKQMTYYNQFNEKIGEIKPIKVCYYAFMPVILIISWINDPVFWSGIFGLLDVILLCMMLFIFTFFMNDIHKETCRKLF